MKSSRTHCHVKWSVFWNRNPDEGDRFGLRKVALFEPPEAALNGRAFYWIYSPWKLVHTNDFNS